MQYFNTGATRDSDTDKYDYEGFLSPHVMEEFGKYMHKNRKQADGNLRDSDNWQKGIPRTNYIKSLLRHVHNAWKHHRQREFSIDDWMAIIFNAQGYVLEQLIADGKVKESIRPKETVAPTKNQTVSDNHRGSLAECCEKIRSEQSRNLEKRSLLEPDSVRVPSVPV